MKNEKDFNEQGQTADERVSEENQSGLKVKTGIRAGEEEGTWVATKTG